MKKNLFFLFALICSVSLFTACSDDDDNKGGVAVEKVNGTYEANSLELTYSGAPLTGKRAIFHSADGQNATITLSGAALSLFRSDLGLNNPSVIPGEASTTLNVSLKPSGESYTFDGIDAANGRTINYTGSVQDGKLNLNLNVAFSANELTGKWDLQAPGWENNPISLDWNTSKKFEIKVFGIPAQKTPGEILTLFSAVSLIPSGDEKLNIHEAMGRLLQNVSFLGDGNIVASYSDKENMASPVWKESPLNMAHYTVKDEKLVVYLNADALLDLIMKPANKAFNPSSILELLLPKLLELTPMLSQGVALNYEVTEDGNLTVSLEKDLVMGLVEALYPLFENPEFISYVKTAAASQPDFVAYVDMVGDILDQFVSVVSTTTDMKLGLKFSKPADN